MKNKFDALTADEKAKARARLACNELQALGESVHWLQGALDYRNIFFVISTDEREISADTKNVLRKHRLDYAFHDTIKNVVNIYGY